MLRRFALALSYVTCLPVPKVEKADEKALLAGLAKYLPAAGLLIGLILAAIDFALSHLHVNAYLSAAILTVLWLKLTNAIHFDGLMDTADGISSHQPVERVLEIMQDSRVGNYGVLVGISVIILKVFCLASLPQPQTSVLILAPTWARYCELYAIGKFHYLKEQGKGKIWHDTTAFPLDLIKGGISPLIATLVLVATQGLACLGLVAAVLMTGALAAHWLNAQLGGHTGDTYGAVVEIAEVGGLLLYALSICAWV